MSTQRCLLGSLVGGLILFFVGYLLYGVLLVGFFEANAGSATGVNRASIDFVALAVGQFVWGGVLTMIIDWKKDATPFAGAKTGLIVGGLFFLGFDLTLYASTNLSNLVGSLADAVVATILFGIAGAAIVAVTGKKAAA